MVCCFAQSKIIFPISVMTGILILMCLTGVILIVDPHALAPNSTLPKLNIIASVVALCK